MNQAARFDPKHPDFWDDWDARVELWESFPPSALPEPLSAAMRRMLDLHEAFNIWVTDTSGTYSITRHQEECWGDASELESLTCKALIEWQGGQCEAAVVAQVLEKCSRFYEAKMHPTPLRGPRG